MRTYLNARASGMGAARAAAVAQDLPLPEDTDTDRIEARRGWKLGRPFGVVRALIWMAAFTALAMLLLLMFG